MADEIHAERQDDIDRAEVDAVLKSAVSTGFNAGYRKGIEQAFVISAVTMMFALLVIRLTAYESK